MKKKSILRNIIITLLALVAAGVISFIFQRLEVQEHITTIFVFSVFIVSLFTDGYFYGIFSSVVGTVAINFVFTYPFLKFDFITPVNVISAIIMLAIAVTTGMLTTKIKTYEEAKAESEREKTRANLLRAVSHDLRTPLTSIYSASSLLRDEKETLTEEQKVEVTVPDDIVIIDVDPILIEQVILNLLENSVYHAKGMTVLLLKAFTLADQVVFEVADNGCGIEESRLKTLFSECYEVQQDMTQGPRRYAGIGLSVCSTIVRAHGGTITAENRKNGGALFRFTIGKEEISHDQ